MARRASGNFFRQNMRLFTAIFVVICIIAAGAYVGLTARHRIESIQGEYAAGAKILADKLDNRLINLRRMFNNVSQLVWIKKLATSSDVFIKDFTVPERVERQKELALYMTVDASISDIAIYIADREMVLCQNGWFSENEYRAYLAARCDLDLAAVFDAAKRNVNVDQFGQAPYNLASSKYIAFIVNLIDTSAPPSSLILISRKEAFGQNLAGLEGASCIRVVTPLGDTLLSFGASQAKQDYRLQIPSNAFPLYFDVRYPDAASLLSRYSPLNLPFVFCLLAALTLAVIVSYLLSRHSSRPVQNLIEKINGVTGEAPAAIPPKENEFERIESSFMALYAQNIDQKNCIRDHFNLARRYALLLALSGDERIVQWTEHFQELDIPFTKEQIYSVWSVALVSDTSREIDLTDMLDELQPRIASAEQIDAGAREYLLIIGENACETPLNADETAEWMKSIALQRQNALLQIRIGKACGPGIAGIAQSYHGLFASEREEERNQSKRKTGLDIINYIDENFCDPNMSLKDLSLRWELSVPTISRLCKEACGTSFLERLTDLRLEKAKELLLKPDMTVAQVVEAVGYASEYSFRRAFLRREQCKLQDWLAQNAKNP